MGVKGAHKVSRVHFRQGLGLALCRNVVGSEACQGPARVLREGLMATRLGHLGETQPQCVLPAATSDGSKGPPHPNHFHLLPQPLPRALDSRG